MLDKETLWRQLNFRKLYFLGQIFDISLAIIFVHISLSSIIFFRFLMDMQVKVMRKTF